MSWHVRFLSILLYSYFLSLHKVDEVQSSNKADAYCSSLDAHSSSRRRHLQLHTRWDKQNVMTIKENVTANQRERLVLGWRALSILHSHMQPAHVHTEK